MSRWNPAKLKQKNTELALWKLGCEHPAIERAKALFPDVATIMLYERGRTPKRRSIESGRRWRYQRSVYGDWMVAEQKHYRQPLNGKRPVLVGWREGAKKITSMATFIWNL